MLTWLNIKARIYIYTECPAGSTANKAHSTAPKAALVLAKCVPFQYLSISVLNIIFIIIEVVYNGEYPDEGLVQVLGKELLDIYLYYWGA